jgi:DNA-directed RNA polymerase specialized sigma24 family protein
MIEQKRKRNYVNNPEFLDAIVKYKGECVEAEESGEPNPRIPNYIGQCIYQIATRLASKPNFSGYSYKEEMISDGLENAIQALGNFDPNKSSNPFAYFTQIIWYAFLRRIDKEKKQLYIKHKVIENSVVFGTAVEKDDQDAAGDAGYIDLKNDYMNDFVKTYEKKLDEKKAKEASKKVGLEKFINEDNNEEDKIQKS